MSDTLTLHEIELLELASWGYTDKEIAEEWTISVWTIRDSWREIFKKLDATNRTQAVAIAIREGFLE